MQSEEYFEIFWFSIVLEHLVSLKEFAEVLSSGDLITSLKSQKTSRNGIKFFWQFQSTGHEHLIKGNLQKNIRLSPDKLSHYHSLKI